MNCTKVPGLSKVCINVSPCSITPESKLDDEGIEVVDCAMVLLSTSSPRIFLTLTTICPGPL